MRMTKLALGVDVSQRHGLDLVFMDGDRKVELPQHSSIENFPKILKERNPDIVAVDSPPKFGIRGNSRLAERETNRHGIKIFYTPSDPKKCCLPFYDWMRVGHLVFQAAEACGYRDFKGSGSAAGRVIEVFPHASAVVLKGCLPPPGWKRNKSSKRDWRLGVLKKFDIKTDLLKTVDQADAALAALTGILALEGDFSAVGQSDEGAIVLPARTLRDNYPRCP
jgi:predicted nuclease with RNAse H fold